MLTLSPFGAHAAGEVFRIMRDEKLADRVSYNLMMRVLAKARRRKLLHELLGQHRAAGYERDARDLLVELELELDNRRLDAAWKAYEAIARETDGMLRGKLSPASALFVGDDGDDILVDDGGDDSSVRADDDGSGVQLLPAAAAGTALAVADRPSSGLAVARAVTDARRVRAKALTSLLRKAVDLGRSEVAIDCVRELNAIEAPPPGDAYRLLLKLRAVGPPALHEQLQALLPPLPAAKHVRRFVPMKGVPRT